MKFEGTFQYMGNHGNGGIGPQHSTSTLIIKT